MRDRIRLVPLTAPTAALALADRGAFAATEGLPLAEDWATAGLEGALSRLVDRFGVTLGAWVFWIVEDEVVVGEIGARSPPAHGAVEVGYRVAPSARGRGTATRALELFVAYAVAHGAARVRAEIVTENVASRRVLEKAGFVREETSDTAQTTCWERRLRS